MMSVNIVTGATGRIGFALCIELKKRGAYVRAVCRVLNGVAKRLAEFVDEIVLCDITDPITLNRAFAGADYVYHVAGIVSIETKVTEEIWRVNIEGTRNVIAACKHNNIKRLVYTGTVHAIPVLDKPAVMREIPRFDPDKVHDAYSKSKAIASNLILDAAADGLDAVIGMPSGVIGAYEYYLSNLGQLVALICAGKYNIYIPGEYNYVDTVDVAWGLCELCDKGVSGESYLLSGYSIKVKEMLEIIARHAGVKSPKIKVPMWLARMSARMMEKSYLKKGMKPLFTPYSLRVLTENCNFSFEKMNTLCGYTPRSLDEAFASQVKFYREELEGKSI